MCATWTVRAASTGCCKVAATDSDLQAHNRSGVQPQGSALSRGPHLRVACLPKLCSNSSGNPDLLSPYPSDWPGLLPGALLSTHQTARACLPELCPHPSPACPGSALCPQTAVTCLPGPTLTSHRPIRGSPPTPRRAPHLLAGSVPLPLRAPSPTRTLRLSSVRAPHLLAGAGAQAPPDTLRHTSRQG